MKLKGVKGRHFLTSHLSPLTSFYYLCRQITDEYESSDKYKDVCAPHLEVTGLEVCSGLHCWRARGGIP